MVSIITTEQVVWALRTIGLGIIWSLVIFHLANQFRMLLGTLTDFQLDGPANSMLDRLDEPVGVSREDLAKILATQKADRAYMSAFGPRQWI